MATNLGVGWLAFVDNIEEYRDAERSKYSRNVGTLSNECVIFVSMGFCLFLFLFVCFDHFQLFSKWSAAYIAIGRKYFPSMRDVNVG